MSTKNQPLLGVEVVPFGLRIFNTGGYSTRDLLGPSTILTKLSHPQDYVN